LNDLTLKEASPDARGMWNRGFLSLLATQFFEAASDNIVKGVIAFGVALGGPWETAFGKGGNGVVGVAFTLPFILLSAFGGRIADRCSKSRITVILKTISLGVCAFCAFEFARGSAWGALAALVAFAIVSAFFGPVKYGMIAELVPSKDLSRENGIINMATNVAVIVGTLVAGLVAQRWKDGFVDGAPDGSAAWLPGIAMAVFVTLGFLTSLTLPKMAWDSYVPESRGDDGRFLVAERAGVRGPRGLDGILGRGFFEDRTVTVDFAARAMTQPLKTFGDVVPLLR
jgi:acyl-[acyl-carrier-protein]-phospholipid O-acyltransferase/long-chain-fatty-acid--[acyl-carrier-protein] ligase